MALGASTACATVGPGSTSGVAPPARTSAAATTRPVVTPGNTLVSPLIRSCSRMSPVRTGSGVPSMTSSSNSRDRSTASRIPPVGPRGHLRTGHDELTGVHAPDASEMLGSNSRHAMWPDRKGEPMAATVVVSCPGSGRIGST